MRCVVTALTHRGGRLYLRSMLPSTIETLTVAEAYRNRSEATVAATRYRIARSVRRLHPTFVLRGGSFDDDPLVTALRHRLAIGELPLILSGECWAGPASGRYSCAVCGVAIANGGAEYEAPTGNLHAHPSCFLTWRQESLALARSRQSTNNSQLGAIASSSDVDGSSGHALEPAKPENTLLRQKARQAIERRRMPNREPDRFCGALGVGHMCSVCERPVTTEETDLELCFRRDGTPETVYHLHVRCYTAWVRTLRDGSHGLPRNR